MKTYFLNNHLTEAAYAFILNTNNADNEVFKAISDHIENCQSCYFELYELKDMIEDINHIEKKPSFNISKIVKIAALLLITISTYYVFQLVPQSNKGVMTNSKFEQMLGDELRSEQIMSTPHSISTLDEDAIFTFTEDAKMELIIVDVAEKIVLRKKPENKTIRIRKSDLSIGVFYWKLETNTELIKVGKFIVD